MSEDTQNVETSAASPRTMAGLRRRLFDLMDGLHSKSIGTADVIASAKAAAQIVNATRTEMEYFQILQRSAETGAPTPKLGGMKLAEE
jgi:hypothetical protein